MEEIQVIKHKYFSLYQKDQQTIYFIYKTMLTVPKLPHQLQVKNNHTQPAFSFPFSGSSKHLQQDLTPEDFYIKSKIPVPNNYKGKQNLPIQKRNLLIDNQFINIDMPRLRIKTQISDPFTEMRFLPQKDKILQRKQSPPSSARTPKIVRDQFSPKYMKQRQENQKILQSLKLENEKYKKLIQENQFLKNKTKTNHFTQFNFLTQKKENYEFLPKTKIPTEVQTARQTRKVLDEMTNLTTSFVIDEDYAILKPKLDEGKKNEQTLNKFRIVDFQKLKFLGKGNFGQVNLVRHKRTNFICAMKTIKKSFVKQENVVHQISRQIRIHLSLKHLNIITFYGFFDDKENIYFLIEYATGGQLFKRLKQCYRMSQDEVIPIIRDALDGLRMIHSLQYIHRDIKPQNIIFQLGIAKICDMGWAAECSSTNMRKSFCGTPLYLPPEMIKKQEYDQSADIWSMGILTYELLVGKIPFNIWSQNDLQQIVDREINYPTNYVDMSKNSIDFMRKCLNKNPSERIKLDELSRHPFLRGLQKEGYFNVQVYNAVERLFS